MTVKYPHCDQRVLHAPSKCIYCDLFPDMQLGRRMAGIAFSGEEPVDGQLPCPADVAVATGQRGDYNQWYGNVATKEPVQWIPPMPAPPPRTLFQRIRDWLF